MRGVSKLLKLCSVQTFFKVSSMSCGAIDADLVWVEEKARS
jgi:hypothetical protein